MQTTLILLTATGIVFLAMLLGIRVIRATQKGRIERLGRYYTNLLLSIIVVPLHEILDNIYQLLSHAPTCQSSVAFTPLQRVLHHVKETGTNDSLG